jgi:hypothetical protein
MSSIKVFPAISFFSIVPISFNFFAIFIRDIIGHLQSVRRVRRGYLILACYKQINKNFELPISRGVTSVGGGEPLDGSGLDSRPPDEAAAASW